VEAVIRWDIFDFRPPVRQSKNPQTSDTIAIRSPWRRCWLTTGGRSTLLL
jgi:hypothetical protein